MSAAFKLAMPLGSKWVAFNHKLNRPLGARTVTAHRSTFMELTVTDGPHKGIVSRLSYPLANAWKLDRDHVRIGDKDGILLTYAPAE